VDGDRSRSSSSVVDGDRSRSLPKGSCLLTTPRENLQGGVTYVLHRNKHGTGTTGCLGLQVVSIHVYS
jgi:hypothetical protein